MLTRSVLTSRALALAALLVGAAAPRHLVAQSASTTVAGSWLADFVRGVRVVNGGEEEEEKGHARITLTAKGDAVLGTWQTITTGGETAPKPRQLRGVIANGVVRLVSEPSEVTMNRNGTESTMPVTTTYEFTIAGDSLSGTMQLAKLDGTALMGARRFSAARERKS